MHNAIWAQIFNRVGHARICYLDDLVEHTGLEKINECFLPGIQTNYQPHTRHKASIPNPPISRSNSLTTKPRHVKALSSRSLPSATVRIVSEPLGKRVIGNLENANTLLTPLLRSPDVH